MRKIKQILIVAAVVGVLMIDRSIGGPISSAMFYFIFTYGFIAFFALLAALVVAASLWRSIYGEGAKREAPKDMEKLRLEEWRKEVQELSKPTAPSRLPQSGGIMLGWLRLKAWQSAVGADFEDKYGLNIYRFSQATVGPTMTKLIFEKVATQYYHNTILGGEQIARILEQAHSIPVNNILRDTQMKLMQDGKWDRDLITVPYHDPSVGA